MKTVTAENEYPGFGQHASSLAKFISAGSLFTLMLKNGKIVHYTPRDKDSFKQWLLDNQVIDIKK